MIVHSGQEAFGFDLCEALVRRGARSEVDQDMTHCGVADAAQLPVADNSFDKVISYAMFQCLPDEATAMRVVRELVRVCKPGGIVFIGNVSGVLEKHRRSLSRFGLREESVESLLNVAVPLWRLRRHWRRESPPFLYVRRGLFRQAAAGLPCEVHFNTFGVRPGSHCRYDVCIHKDEAEINGIREVVVSPEASNAVSTPLQIQCHSSFEELVPLRDQWDQLAEAVGADMFASFDWCSTWWRHFGQDRAPEIYLAKDQGRLVACLPFFRETIAYGPWHITVVRLIGSCDAGTRCDLAIEPEFIDVVMREISRRLDESGPWDVIHIGDLSGEYAHGRAVAHALQRGMGRGRVIYRSGYFPNSVFDVPGSFDDYLQQLSANERSSIRRTQRRLVEEHQAQVVCTTPEELDSAFVEFQRQHQTLWAQEGRLGYFRDWPGSLEFHRDFSTAQAKKGRLLLLRIQAGDQTIAFHYSHRFGRRIHWFSGSRSPDPKWDAYSLGRQLHCAVVREAVARNVTQIDGMNGYYDFKKRWGARYTQLQNITVMSQDVLSRIAVRDFLSASRLHCFFNRVWFWHLAPWLRRRFPDLTFLWLRRGLTRKFVRSRFLEYALATGADDAVCYRVA